MGIDQFIEKENAIIGCEAQRKILAKQAYGKAATAIDLLRDTANSQEPRQFMSGHTPFVDVDGKRLALHITRRSVDSVAHGGDERDIQLRVKLDDESHVTYATIPATFYESRRIGYAGTRALTEEESLIADREVARLVTAICEAVYEQYPSIVAA